MNTKLKVKQIFFLFDELKKIYPLIIKKYSKKFHEELELPERYYYFTLRGAIQSTTYLFFYKLYKYKNYINFDKLSKQKNIYNFAPISPMERDKKLKEVNFNKYIDSLLGIDDEYSDFISDIPKSNIFDLKDIQNHLFDSDLFSRYLAKFNKLMFLITNFFFKKRNIYMSMANDDENFWKFSFFKFSNIRLAPNWNLENKEINQILREKIFNNNYLDFDQFNILLKNLKFEEKYFNVIKKKLNDFYRILIPITLLESSHYNYINAKEIFDKRKPNYIITGNGGDFYSEILNAFAASKNIHVINCQHGGYYGYLNYMRYLINEIPSSKSFITWGWKNCYNLNNTNLVDLPSPWLSERKKYWNKLNIDYSKNKINIIFMPQSFKYFDTFPLNSSFVNIDVSDIYKKNFYNLISVLNENNISTLVKYYSPSSFNLLYDEHRELESKSSKKYIVENNFNKGISRNLLQKAKILVWDTPGTGFLECISSGIPTIVYWDRSISEELPESQIFFEKLESIGIINSTIDKTLKQIQLYLQSPENWINDKQQRNELIEFKNNYCRTDKYWWKKWKIYLKDINNEFLH